MRKVLITGITGQDGSYLAEFLPARNYHVHGIVRRASTFNTGRIDHLYKDAHDPEAHLFLHYGDLTDGSSLRRILVHLSEARAPAYARGGPADRRTGADE